MPGRLTDHISELIGADQLERLSSILQTTPAAAATAFRAALDATVEGLAEVATPAGGTTRLGVMLEREGITALDRLDEVLERGEDVDGMQLAADILGPRVDDVADSVTSAASLESRDAGLLTLGFTAPLAVSTLARRQRDETLTAAAIGALLIAERDQNAAALTASSEVAPPPTAEAQLAAKALDATRAETARHEVEEGRRRKYAWPFIVLFAIIGVILAIVLTTTLGGSDDEPPAESAEAEAPAAEPSTPPPPAEPEPPTDVLAIASADGGFTILLGALDATGLDAELSGSGPLTLLAPTDEAFESLPDGVVESLLADPVRL